jgi:hypothetical protein
MDDYVGSVLFNGKEFKFDPLKLSETYQPFLPWFRESELRHGRTAVCMTKLGKKDYVEMLFILGCLCFTVDTCRAWFFESSVTVCFVAYFIFLIGALLFVFPVF